MNQLKVATPPSPATPPAYYLDDQLPTQELVFLDGAAGVGKSYYLTKVASCLSRGDHHLLNPQPVDVLYVATPRQQELLAEQFSQHPSDPEHLQQIAFADIVKGGACLNDYLAAFNLLLDEARPQVLILDGLEELLEQVRLDDGKPPEQATFASFWTDLRQISLKHGCTIIVPRQHGLHQSRSYGAHIKSGTLVARNIITIGYHPINACRRVIITAKNQRGLLGEQYHLELLRNGNSRLVKAAPHEHARPSKSPATWQADRAISSEENEIIELVGELMDGTAMPKQLLEEAVTKLYSKRAYHRAMSKMKMESKRCDNTLNWFWVPTARMRMEAYFRKQEGTARTAGAAGEPDNVHAVPQNQSARGIESAPTTARTSDAGGGEEVLPIKKAVSPLQKRSAS